jgi:hypothetical protein
MLTRQKPVNEATETTARQIHGMTVHIYAEKGNYTGYCVVAGIAHGRVRPQELPELQAAVRKTNIYRKPSTKDVLLDTWF